MDTTDLFVPPDPPAQTGSFRPRRSRWWVAFAVTASSLVLLLVGSLFVHVPYATIEPGSARPVENLVEVKGHDVYKPTGQILFTTVGVRENVSAFQAVVGWLDPNIDVLSEHTLRGDVPQDKYKQLNVDAMTDSKTAAEEVVLRHLGYDDLGAGATVYDVDPKLPAGSILRPKDLVVAVDGQPVKTSAEAADAIRAHQPGDTITLSVARDGAPPTDLSAVLAKGEVGQALLGVRMTTEIKLPFPITIDSGNVEGPSAGLAYGLTLLDELTPGELTGGQKVAVTGELSPDGKVGPIGGIAQKVVAVERAGAKLFLVPRANYADAAKHAGGVEVRPVDTFDDALKVLGSYQGSNALALAAPGGGGGS